MAERPERPSAITPTEWEIMKVLWEGGPMAVGDIHQQLSEGRDWSYATVKTLARRLVQKGWLSYQRVGRSFLYRAAVPHRQAVREEIRRFSARVLDGLLEPFVAFHAERGELTPEDIERLEAILEQHRHKGRCER